MIDWETTEQLTALTHLDGRNSHKLTALRRYFSEFAWMKMRLSVIVSYTKSIASELTGKSLSRADDRKFSSLVDTFSLTEARKVVQLEKSVNHDLKALELYCASRLKGSHPASPAGGLSRLTPFINLGLGSEDINSMAFAMLLKKSREEVLLPAIREIVDLLVKFASKEKETIMVARTHGQPANVTTFGKEIAVPLSRLCDEVELFQSMTFQAKCSGEVGSYQAFLGVDPSLDAIGFTDRFIHSLGLVSSAVSTQIAPYDSLVRYLQSLYRINSILLDLTKNMWLYVLLGYLKVKKVDAEVGSSGMPHKVNPIYFEGAEGGLEMANGIIEIFCRKLPVNRLQRDFSDSTMRRNVVTPLALGFLSYQSIATALERIEVNTDTIAEDLNSHAEVWTETVKTYGTIRGIGDMYERLKRATRGRVLSQRDLQNLITGLPLKETEKQELMSICRGQENPFPARIVSEVLKRAKKIL
ncbi:MAG: lyase family protein [Patescibacteria group bacterium]